MNLPDKMLCVICGVNLSWAGLDAAFNDPSGAALSLAVAVASWSLTYWQPGERK